MMLACSPLLEPAGLLLCLSSWLLLSIWSRPETAGLNISGNDPSNALPKAAFTSLLLSSAMSLLA